MAAEPPRPPCVFIHGAWMTPACWDSFAGRFAERGHAVHTPAWPGKDRPVEEIRRDPSPLRGLGLAEIADHYAAMVRALPEPPVLIGHSFGGLVVQLLLDRGLGAAGIAIDSAPPRGVPVLRPSALRSVAHVLADPLRPRRVVGLSYPQFRYAFTHTLSEDDAAEAYRRHVVPDTARIFFQTALAPLQPRSPARVDFSNSERPPLLLIGGELDRIVPVSVTRANHRRYARSRAATDLATFPGRTHWIIAQPGWEAVADVAARWLERSLDPPWRPPWQGKDAREVRVVTFNTAGGNPKITTSQADFVQLPFYREALEDAPGAPLIALQEVGPAQARALRRAARDARCHVLQVRRPGLGNAVVIPARYQVLSVRRSYMIPSQIAGIASGLRRWAVRHHRPDLGQLGELRMSIEARLRDRASGRELTVINTHISGEAAMKLPQTRAVVRRAEAAARRGPVILAGDFNVPAGQASGPDLEVTALLARLRDMGTAVPGRRKNIDYVLADGFEPVSSRIWMGDSLKLPGSPSAETVSDHYPEDDVMRFAEAGHGDH
jgi:pimeloyl-ACP methyl ester carboxylesterase/endonuclease/exonuclease/phosphatase family metal-dependent hydrolase